MDIKNILSKRGTWIGLGVAFILLSLTIVGLMVWEIIGKANTRFQALELPGFHTLELVTPGLYAGVYQHNKAGPIPTASLSQLQVRVMSSETFQDIPVLVNTSGQTFSQFGLSGMALFNFAIEKPGSYTMSAIYPDNPGPDITVLLMSQAVRDIKPTLIVGVMFFVLFLWLGVWIIVKSKEWII